jgi:pyruvate/2-oxoglutarate dehydrogenase complex dihydrolipoamide dehydrogenase (E3) component
MERFDAVIIGGGGTGSTLIESLLDAKLSVAMAERHKLGGECANYGCDPTKALLKAAKLAAWARKADAYGIRVKGVEVDYPAVIGRVRRLIDEELKGGATPYTSRGATVWMQEARLTGDHRIELADGEPVEADRVILATGSTATTPPIDGLAGTPWWSNVEAIWQERLPDSLIILGSGPIGVEFAQIYARLGTKVTVVELFERILIVEDFEAAEAMAPVLESDGIQIHTSARTQRVEHGPAGFTLHLADGQALSAQHLLVATGRKPVFDAHDLAAAGVELNDLGRPVLNETLRTTNPAVWAAGDATGELLFTHVGSYEAGIVSADIRGRPRPKDYRVVPKVTYTDPEIASVGLTEEQAVLAGHSVKVGLERFDGSTRAFLEGEPTGFVKLVADASTGELLGGHIVGQGAGELIHQVVVMMATRAPVDAAARAIHAYPTWSQSVRSAWSQLVRD